MMSSHERVGFILHTGEIVEVPNIAKNPTQDFEVQDKVLIAFEDLMQATWHTHTNGNAELTSEDYTAFLMWPDLIHFIACDGNINGYTVKNRVVVKDAGKDHPAWAFAESLALWLRV